MPDTGQQTVHFSWGGDEEKESLSLEKLIARLELLQMKYKTLAHDRRQVLKSIGGAVTSEGRD